jgi:hypothetical protein
VTDIPTYTVCALLRDDDPPQRWSGATWTTEAADAGMAVALCEMEARKEVSTDGRLICRGLALACVHPGNIDRAGVIWSATEEFTVGQVEYERDRHPLGLFTVCGLDRGTFCALHYWVEAHGPAMAYLEARELAEAAGRELLHAATHEGHVPRIDQFGYADPYVDNEAAMRLTAQDWRVL